MPRPILSGSLLVMGLLAAAVAGAQTPPPQGQTGGAAASTPASVAGKYAGTAVTPDGAMPFSAELKVEKGVITGTIAAGDTLVTITSGSVAGDKFTLAIEMAGTPGSIAGTYKDGKFEGQWTHGGDTGAFSMARATAGPATPATTPTPAAPATAQAPAGTTPAAPAGDPLSGDWDAVIDAGGNQVPFTLSMKLDGQKVTGQLASDMGTVPFEGTWTTGTLNFAFAGPGGGSVVMAASLVEGKLAGTFSIGDGQMTGGWAAAKRK